MQTPDWTKFSEADTYLSKLIRDLNGRVSALEAASPNAMTRSFIHMKRALDMTYFCQGTTHVFLDDDATCTCGMVPR